MSWIVFVDGILLAFACATLALSQDTHWYAVSGQPLEKAAKLTLIYMAWALLFITLIPLMLIEGGGFGVLLWGLLIAVSCFAIAMTLTYQPHWLTPIVFCLLRLTTKQ